MRSASWRWLAMAGSVLVGGCLGSDSGARCEGTLVSGGGVCVVTNPISETGFDCPLAMPFEYFGEGWALCSDQALDDFQQGEALDEAFPDQPNEPGPQDPDRPNEPGPQDPDPEPTEPEPCTVDTDGDGIIDCDDACPADSADCGEPTEPTEPTEPADCAVDVDADGVPDCQDACLDHDGIDMNGDGLICSDDGFVDGCENNSECFSGWCVESAEGYFCAMPCIETCPVGFECKAVDGTPDPTFLCLPQ